jgi:hypothetical protein
MATLAWFAFAAVMYFMVVWLGVAASAALHEGGRREANTVKARSRG